MMMAFAGIGSSYAFYNVVFRAKCWPQPSDCKH